MREGETPRPADYSGLFRGELTHGFWDVNGDEASAPPQDLVRRAAEHCERLTTQADTTAAKRELRGHLVSIDPPAVCR